MKNVETKGGRGRIKNPFSQRIANHSSKSSQAPSSIVHKSPLCVLEAFSGRHEVAGKIPTSETTDHRDVDEYQEEGDKMRVKHGEVAGGCVSWSYA